MSSRIRDRIRRGSISVVSVISYHEIMAGLKRLRGKRELEFFESLFNEITIIPFDEEAAVCSSDIASRLMLSGSPVNGFDILIAGSAVSRQASGILTADSDFQVIAPAANLPVISYHDILKG